MVMTAHLTELEAVNEILRSIGESPVQGLNSGQQDAEQAAAVLLLVSRRIQAQGWYCNTRRGVVLTKNSDNQFPLGVNVLKVDTVNPRRRSDAGDQTNSKRYNVVMRRAADGLKFILYDLNNNTEVWTTPDTLTVDVIEFLPFDDLTPLLQSYIHMAAGHRYQKTAVSSQVLWEFTKEDVDESTAAAIQEDADNEDESAFTDGAPAEIVRRNNPLYGS
jgi:hypothetical protein